MSRIAGGLVLVAVALAAGCGGGDDGAASPKDVVQTFYDAIAAGDGETACAQLSEEGLGNIPEDPANCAGEVSAISEEDRAKLGEIDSIEQVTGDTEHCGTITASDTNAEVFVTAGENNECVNLSKVDGVWKINDN